jgi:PAS domain-containing protein
MAKYQRENPASPIPLLYRTLDDAQLWEPALNALAEDLGADHIVLDLQADLAPMIVATRVAPNHIAQFASHHEYRQLRGLVTHSTPGCTLRGESIIDQRLQARSEFYADVIRPMGGYHALFALTSRAAGTQTALLSACRSSRKRGFESRHLEKLDAFLPHLETVIRLQRRITHSAVENWWHETILKALPVGIILLDAQGKPCYINPAAESLLNNTSALSCRHAVGLTPATQPPNGNCPKPLSRHWARMTSLPPSQFASIRGRTNRMSGCALHHCQLAAAPLTNGRRPACWFSAMARTRKR